MTVQRLAIPHMEQFEKPRLVLTRRYCTPDITLWRLIYVIESSITIERFHGIVLQILITGSAVVLRAVAST